MVFLVCFPGISPCAMYRKNAWGHILSKRDFFLLQHILVVNSNVDTYVDVVRHAFPIDFPGELGVSIG